VLDRLAQVARQLMQTYGHYPRWPAACAQGMPCELKRKREAPHGTIVLLK